MGSEQLSWAGQPSGDPAVDLAMVLDRNQT